METVDDTNEMTGRSRLASGGRALAARSRRGYDDEFKLQVLQEIATPGASVAAVARRHGMNTNVIFKWRNLYREGKLGAETPPCTNLLPPPEFIRVHVVEEDLPRPALPAGPPAPPQVPAVPKLPRRRTRGAMEIILRCGVIIRVDADVDDVALSRVVSAVGDLA